ncbi:MAG TPA: AI-2E family transporter [Myxococcota bacterium]|nr:AI-2E family transporter [Myxococcota bacterium]
MDVGQTRPGLVVARVLVGLGLLGATLWVLHPFIIPGVWAAIVAYVTWPVFARVRDWSRRPRLCAVLFTVFFALAIAVPVASLLLAFAGEASVVADRVKHWVDAGAPLPDFVTETPWLARRASELRGSPLFGPTAAGEWLSRYGQVGSEWAVALGSGIARNVVDFLITAFVLFAFYLDGERVGATARRLGALLLPGEGTLVVDEVGAIVRAVVFGLLGTALAQGIMAGAGFWVFGVPSPVFFGFATVLAAFLPGGATLIWLGACVWLWAQGSIFGAIGLALWCGVLITSIDNLLRPWLISGPTQIPFILVFFGVLGGLAGLGLVGMFVGPVLLAVGFGVLAEFPTRYRGSA